MEGSPVVKVIGTPSISWSVSNGLELEGLIFSDFDRVLVGSQSLSGINITDVEFENITNEVLNFEEGIFSSTIEKSTFGKKGTPQAKAFRGRTQGNVIFENNSFYSETQDTLISVKRGSGLDLYKNFFHTNGVAVGLELYITTEITDNNFTYSSTGVYAETTTIQVDQNKFDTVLVDAIVIDKGGNNLISKNIIDYLVSPLGNAISLVNKGNNDKKAPELTRYTIFNGELILHGTAGANDRIETFLGSAHGQEAKKYLADIVAGSNGKWSMKIPVEDIDLNGTNYLVATATDVSNNTSELSDALTITLATCMVTSNGDDGNGSFRHALDSINLGLCNLVLFDITPTLLNVETIEIETALPTITKSDIIIDASSESGFFLDSVYSVAIKPKAGGITRGIEIENTTNVSVHGLSVEEFGYKCNTFW